MNNNNIYKTFLSLIGGMCCLGLQEAKAASAPCPATPVTVVNESEQAARLKGNSEEVFIPPKSSVVMTLQSNYFYARCGLIQLSIGTETKSALIDGRAKKVDIRIGFDNGIEQKGLTSQGFDLDEYILLHGYKEILHLGLKPPY